jgi:hypothetical protein
MSRIAHLFGHWLACKDATRLLSQLEEREPTTLERIRLRWHLAACDACTRFRDQLGTLREAMRRYGR